MLAHKAAHEGRVAVDAANGKKTAFAPAAIPAVVFTDPEVAWVGLTEEDARRQGIKVGKGVFPWAASGRSLSLGRDEGLTKVLFDEESNRIVGCGIVGPSAGDLIAEALGNVNQPYVDVSHPSGHLHSVCGSALLQGGRSQRKTGEGVGQTALRVRWVGGTGAACEGVDAGDDDDESRRGGEMAAITEAAVMQALSGVQEPELGRDIVTLDMVKELTVDGSAVGMMVELTTPACPLKDVIERDIRAALAGIGADLRDLRWGSKVRRAAASTPEQIGRAHV